MRAPGDHAHGAVQLRGGLLEQLLTGEQHLRGGVFLQIGVVNQVVGRQAGLTLDQAVQPVISSTDELKGRQGLTT